MKYTIGILVTLSLAFSLFSCKKQDAITLETTILKRGSLSETVTATGTVESVTQVDVGTQVTGIIDKLYADYNSIVKKGELIAEIEKTMLESDLRSAEANVTSAKLTYDYNRSNYNRDKALHEKQLISDYEFQTSKKDYEVSKAAYDKALADRVRAAKNLNYAEIYSPIDGIVISREVEVGQTVVSSMNVANLYTIADLDNMQIIGNVDEADIGRVKVGQGVKFSVDAYPDDVFEGTVSQVRLNPTTTSNVVTYEVVVATSNPDHKLIPGLTANLTIYVLNEENILLLPNSAFQFSPEPVLKDTPSLPKAQEAIPQSELGVNQKSVWIVNDNSLINKAVTIGLSNGIQTQIIAGIEEGSIIAIGYSSPNENQSEREQATSPFAPKPPKGKK